MTSHYQTHTKTLAQLLPEQNLGEAADIVVRHLCLDSRQLKTGDAFIALAGTQVDGRQFIAKAIEAGAAVILVEADKNWQGIDWLGGVPVVAVEQLSEKISIIAGRFYGEPSKAMSLIGVTGTNGKTTCSLLAAQLLASLQKKAGVVGTIGFGLLDASAPFAQQISALTSTGLTTPDPITLQRILNDLKMHGATTAAVEVSSHSLQQKRVAGVQFTTAIFTNLTQDHLDYHGDLASYGNAKAQLLHMVNLRTAIINIDDVWAKSLLDKVPANVRVFTYSVKTKADIYVEDIQLQVDGVRAQLITPWGCAELNSPLLGVFNLSNLLAVIASICVQGFALDQVLPLIKKLQPAPGRMQVIGLDHVTDIQVVVDYAHTPDALENTLQAISEHKPGKIWTVFGCGGSRDKTKRPLMGRAAEKLSDFVIVTNDNPRAENPASIVAEVVRGMKNPNGCLVIADRAQAIDFAVQQAKAGDIVLIAGKGHEEYQIFATQTIPFSDIKQARNSLELRMNKQASPNMKEAL